MGYSYSSVQRIIDDRAYFFGKKIITLGTLYPFLTKSELKKLINQGFNSDVSKEEFSKQLFVGLLGAEVCHSLDVSDYQQSDIICNLNDPLPENLLNQYDVIIDAGTLEHLSNITVALKNLFDLLDCNGIYYFALPANNWIDHGFFQFSPTFFIDLAIDNSNLELNDLHLSTNKKLYRYSQINPFFRVALYSSRERLTVGGVLKKLGDDIDLNLMQTKYRIQYKKELEIGLPTRNSFKSFISNLLIYFAKSVWIPLHFKEYVLTKIYKLKKLI